MVTRKRYSAHDEKVIAEEVGLHPYNVRKGLLIASKKLNRSFRGVQYHWYCVQSKRENAEAAFCCVSKGGYQKNRKNSSETPVKKNVFYKLLKWLGIK